MKKRYNHKSKWKYVIVQEEAEPVVFILNDRGRLITPLNQRKHRDLKILMKDLGFIEQNQDKSSGCDEIINKPNEEKSFKLVFDENILGMNSNNIYDDNNSTTGLTDGYNEYL